jgi:hypothetical protein
MSYETDALEALREQARLAYVPVFAAGTKFANAHSKARNRTDIVEALAMTIDLLVAAEALHDAADGAVKDLRAALSATMDATGATRIEATHHTAMLAKKPAFLNIVDEALIPREYFVQPPPKLDNSAVKSALKDGQQVPGVSLAIPNEMQLRLVTKKEAAS